MMLMDLVESYSNAFIKVWIFGELSDQPKWFFLGDLHPAIKLH